MNIEIKIALIAAASGIITSIITLIGVIISNNKSKAVTEFKIDELTREVREHNGFARRMPVLEEKMNVANHRITDLEAYHKPHN